MAVSEMLKVVFMLEYNALTKMSRKYCEETGNTRSKQKYEDLAVYQLAMNRITVPVLISQWPTRRRYLTSPHQNHRSSKYTLSIGMAFISTVQQHSSPPLRC